MGFAAPGASEVGQRFKNPHGVFLRSARSYLTGGTSLGQMVTGIEPALGSYQDHLLRSGEALFITCSETPGTAMLLGPYLGLLGV